MMYMKSSNQIIARRIAVPNSVFQLSIIRPDMLYYRALGTTLIMWSDVQPSDQWVFANMPPCILTSLWLSCEKKEIVNPTLKALLQGLSISTKSVDYSRQLPVIDALSAFLCIISGYCVGIGLVHAGTANSQASAWLLQLLKLFQRYVRLLRHCFVLDDLVASLRDSKVFSASFGMNNTKHLREIKSFHSLIELCVCQVSLANGCCSAGSGDVSVLRVLRELRWKPEDSYHGTHMALTMAIGLLCLSGGRASLKRDPVSIACLLISFLPRFPFRISDQQYHLQALRHLYVLAVEQRCLVAIDADSNASLTLKVDVLLRSGDVLHETTPCLLPELSDIECISLTPEAKKEYFPAAIYLDANADARHRLPPLYVKQRVASKHPMSQQTKRVTQLPASAPLLHQKIALENLTCV